MLIYSLSWSHMPVIPAVGSLKQEDNHEFKTSPGYIICDHSGILWRLSQRMKKIVYTKTKYVTQ